MSAPRDLLTLRDHARDMADFKSGRPSIECAGNRNAWTVTTWRDPDHDACKSGECRCPCHKPSDRDRELWTRIADEIDAYLQPDDAQEALL